MTITANDRRYEYAGGTAALVFTGPRAFQSSHIEAYEVDDVTGVATLRTDYTLTGVGVRNRNTTLTFSGVIPAGTTLLILRTVPYEQGSDITNQGPYLPQVVEDALDGLSQQLQQVAEGVARSFRAPDTATGVDPIGNTPNRYVVTDSEGKPALADDPPAADLTLRTDFASSASGKGDALIGVLQSGIGMALRSAHDNNALALNIMDAVLPADQAGILSGATGASTALGAVLDEAITRGFSTIRLPAGRFLIDSKITKTLAGGLSIEGAGMGVTQLIMADASGDGLEFNAAAGDGNWWLNVSPSSALRIANLSILSTALNLGTGLKINGNSLEGRPPAPVTLDHVEIRARNSINGQAFLIGLHLFDCGSVFANHCRFLVGGTSNLTPTAVKLEATDATTDPTSFYFDNCEWTYGGKGVVAGDYVEGIYLTNCAMVKVDVGVQWTASAESGLHVIGGHYNCLTRNFDLNGVFDFIIADTLCFLSGGTPLDHVRLDNGGSFTITGNVFRNGAKGLDIQTIAGTTRGGYIGDNQFEGMTTAAVALAGDSNNVTVGLNGYTNVAARVTGAGGAGTFIQKRSWSVSTVPTLVGGATSENVTVTIPTGLFLAKPTVGIITAEGSSADYIATYNSSTATATAFTFRVVRRDGAAIGAGAARFNIVAYE